MGTGEFLGAPFAAHAGTLREGDVYELQSGTRVLISQRIFFGPSGIERHYDTCLDHELPQPLTRCRALPRLAGTHRATGLGDAVTGYFAFDRARPLAADPIRYDAAQLQHRAARFAGFSAAYPQLIPDNLRSADFLVTLLRPASAAQ